MSGFIKAETVSGRHCSDFARFLD